MTRHVLAEAPPFEENCPWCEQPIPHEKLTEIRERIKANERAQTRAIERRLTEELDAKLAAAAAETAEKLAAAEREKVTALERAQSEAAAARTRLEVEFQERLKAELQAGVDARAALKAELAQLDAQHEEALKARLAEQREALEQHHQQQMNSEKALAFTERQQLEDQVAKLQRKLQSKSAAELGEGAELDLFEELKREFPGDEIKRIKRGQPGADIIHKVIDSGRECGTILYDSKNRSAWRNDYVTKLRSDQVAAKADHAVLASAVFRAGSHQLHVQDGAVVANPARVVALVTILRKHLVHVATLRLSDQARAEKMVALYDFVTSERFTQLFERASSINADLLELDVKEKRSHDSVWKKRGELLRSAEQTNGILAAEIDRIVTAPVVPLQKAT